MEYNFEKLCKNCGRRFHGERCPGCQSERWERAGYRSYCEHENCSRPLPGHPGPCRPWPYQYPKEAPMPVDEKDGHVGLYQKYESIRRTDGRDQPGEKHEGCAYFILDLTHDPYAVPALRAYAEACRKTHPQLAIDLWKAVGRGDEDPDVDLAQWDPLQTLEEATRG